MQSDTKKLLTWTLTAAILVFGLIYSSYIVVNGLIKVKGNIRGTEKMITVKGSAKKQIKSDLIVWNCSFSYKSPDIVTAYRELNKSMVKVKDYLVNQGINEKDIVFSSISTIPNHRMTEKGQYTNEVESYTLEQSAEIKSNDVDKITQVSRKSTELLNEGVTFRSSPPQYFYTKISDLKVDMLAEATKDAKNRATQIASNTGSKCGYLRSADMGVFQITPIYSNEVSDYGINDTSSLEKEIMAVVTCRFGID